ncbi:hypothetical protein F5884DRAFT_849181 [Xylogone sp. PMI_703]|nr:hypothetical protein F5884DRAFT_849181 [Xylogone sp. PMI_703]
MRFTSFGAVLGFVFTVNAASMQHRAIFNSTCEQAVAGAANGTKLFNSARADCEKNIVSVIGKVFASPPAVTVTSTKTIYAVAVSSQTLTAIESMVTTSTLFTTETDVEISTAYETSTEDQISTQFITSTPVVTVSITVIETASPSETATVYTPTYVLPSVAKRTVDEPCVLATPSIPAYASACSAFPQYSAACGLIGVSGTMLSTTILPTPTVTVVESTTVTSTSILTVTAQSEVVSTNLYTSVIPETEKITVTLPTVVMTSQTETTTVIAPTSTVVVSVTSTVSGATPTVTVAVSKFKVEMIPVAGGNSLYMKDPKWDGDAVYATTSLDDASLFTVDTQHRLVCLDLGSFATTAYTEGAYYIEFWTPALYSRYQPISDLTPIIFTVNGDLSLTFTQTTSDAHDYTYYPAENQFFYSPPGYEGFPTYTAKIHPVL